MPTPNKHRNLQAPLLSATVRFIEKLKYEQPQEPREKMHDRIKPSKDHQEMDTTLGETLSTLVLLKHPLSY